LVRVYFKGGEEKKKIVFIFIYIDTMTFY